MRSLVKPILRFSYRARFALGIFVIAPILVLGGRPWFFRSGVPATGTFHLETAVGLQMTLKQRCQVRIQSDKKDHQIAAYDGISFVFSSSLASEVRGETVPARVLGREGDKPDAVRPQHTLFTFVGPYATEVKSSFFKHEVHVFSVDEYKRVLAISPQDVLELENLIQTLEEIIVSNRSNVGHKEWLPFLPYGIDASQVFHNHVKVLQFNGGAGIRFLTQYNTEPSLINNDGLVYTFQGLTHDRRIYIAATFPVKAPFLPGSYGSTSAEGFELNYPTEARMWPSFDRKYNDYVLRESRRLQLLPSTQFKPNLIMLDELISSICLETTR